MKKIIIICILAAALIISLAACSNKKNKEQPTELPSGEASDVCTEELIYKLNADGQSYMLVNVGKCKCENIIIPETYNGLPVTQIGDGAFSQCQTVKSITLPASVTGIWHRAFLNCQNLESVNIPSSVKEIGFYVFSGCRSLKTVTIPASVDYVGGDLFKGCGNLSLNCEADSKPDKWESNWSSGIEVNWGYTAE